ncbi:CxC2 domain-containing protein [Mycena indigotica]|uniref:CxC2 domain-containing protein n=1 Tax=Mycena indigotica TaxID=2126181 RepID=A0A8H6W4Z7_9AGAR|nr:CxC2 domain-containing protein [Mycena indigotica]KAF7299424.1 CxC2 domain-containing protein [Mycena indigotica]
MDDYAHFLPEEPLAAEELTAVANTITTSEELEGQIVHEHIIGEDEVTGHKRARYESSDEPMKVWRRVSHIFLDNLLRHDGLGPDLPEPVCFFCQTPAGDSPSTRFFRCQDCGCFSQCHSCLTERHALTPLHVIKEWNGSFWEAAALHRLTLKDESPRSLRMSYQLGHTAGNGAYSALEYVENIMNITGCIHSIF